MLINLFFLYSPKNKYSINALIGAIENLPFIKIHLPNNEKELVELLLKHNNEKIKIVGFSILTEQKEKIKILAKNLKEKFKEIILIAGGPHSSAKPNEVLSFGFDYIFKGESEDLIIDFLLKINKGEKIEDKILYSKKKVNLSSYLPFSSKLLKFGPIEITRGCPYACYYCQTSFLFGTKMRHRSPDSIFNAVEIMSNLGLKDIRFITPSCMSYQSENSKDINIYAIENMLKGVKKIIGEKGRIFFGSFPSEIRPEQINENTIEILKKYAHNKKITIGVQSASEKLLKKINRGHSIKDVENALNICLKNKFIPVLDFIFSLPYETDDDIEETINFINKYTSKGIIIHSHYFTPLPGTPFEYKKAKKISEKLKIIIKHLENKHLSFGKWEKQI